MYAAFARLLSSYSITRFELLLHSQGTNADYTNWALALKEAIRDYPLIEEEIKGMLENSLTQQEFISETRLSAISNCIINFTSSTEYFLVDLIQWKLNNKKILNRALQLTDIKIDKFDITKFDDLITLREKYINQLSEKFSYGALWTNRIVKAHKLFDIDIDKNSETLKSIDSIWEQRNKFAHVNRIHYLPMSFIDLEGNTVEIEDLGDKNEYLKFCSELIRTMNASLGMLDKFQQEIANKWLLAPY